MDITKMFCQGKAITLAKQGEYGQEYSYDYSKWTEEFGAGTVGWLIKRAGDTEAYPIPSVEADNISTITITETETAQAGRGLLEIFFINDGETDKRKSDKLPFMILESLEETDEAPEPWQSYIDAVHADAVSAQQAKETIANLNADGTVGTTAGNPSVIVTKTEVDNDLTLHFAFDGLVPNLTYNSENSELTISYGG